MQNNNANKTILSMLKVIWLASILLSFSLSFSIKISHNKNDSADFTKLFEIIMQIHQKLRVDLI